MSHLLVEALEIAPCLQRRIFGERRPYGRTLFPQADAQAGACSAQGVIYRAAITAGLMVLQLARWLGLKVFCR